MSLVRYPLPQGGGGRGALSRIVKPPLATVAAPQTYYVDNGGLDSHDGLTPGTAWQTVYKVNHAVFNPGDRVLFTAGQTFVDTDLEVYSSGSAGKPITFGSYGAGRATLSQIYFSGYDYLTFDSLICSINGMPFNGNGNNITVNNLLLDGQSNTTLTGSVQLGLSAKGNNWAVTNCTIQNCGLSGLEWYGDVLTCTGNTITNVGLRSPGSPNDAAGYNAHGMYLGQAGFIGSNVFVDSNTIYNPPGSEAMMESGVSQRSRHGIVTNNTIYNCQIAIDFYESDPTGGSSTWSNNRIYNTTAATLYAQGPTGGDFPTSESFTIQNNVQGPIISGVGINVLSSYTTGTVTVNSNQWLVPTPTASAVSTAVSTTVIVPSLTETASSVTSATGSSTASSRLSTSSSSVSQATGMTLTQPNVSATSLAVSSTVALTSSVTTFTSSASSVSSTVGAATTATRLTPVSLSVTQATETIIASSIPFLSPLGISPSSATSSTTATTRLVATGGSVTSSTSRTTAPTLLTGSALSASSVYGSSVYPSDVLPSDELLPGGQIVTAPTLLTSRSSSITSVTGSLTALTALALFGTSQSSAISSTSTVVPLTGSSNAVTSATSSTTASGQLVSTASSVSRATGSATSTTQLTPSSLAVSRSTGAVTAPGVQFVVVSSGSVSQVQSLTTAPYAVTAGASSVSSSTGISTAAGKLTPSSLSVSQALSSAITSTAITSTAIAATSSTSGTTVQQRLSALAAGVSQAGSLTTASGQVVPIAGAVSASTTSQINVVAMLVEYAQVVTAAGDSVSVFTSLSPASTSSTKADAYAAVYVVTPILWVDGCEIVILYAYDETPDAPAQPADLSRIALAYTTDLTQIEDDTDPSAAILDAISINWN